MTHYRKMTISLQHVLKVGALVLLLGTLALALPGSQPARAHGGIVLDGVIGAAEWCFPGFLPLAAGPDARATLTCPGPAPVGTEVIWEDAPGDNTAFFPVDMTYFATTADPVTLYFALGLTAPPPLPHFQIAINVVPGGTAVWHNPAGAPLGGVGVVAPDPPDYLITTNIGAGMATLWEATTAPGVWTIVGMFPMGIGATDVEIGIPWASFGPGACAGCPLFGPGSVAQLTVMSAADGAPPCVGGIPGAPCPGFPEEDVFSEPAPLTDTTAPVACPIPGTACELLDGSADAFITVTYAAPTAVGLSSFSVQSGLPLSWIALPAAALTISTAFWLRRRRQEM